MKKPEFPKPRLIREDFLPEQDFIKNNYRIKKIITPSGYERYYPQFRVLWLFWVNMFGDDGWYDYQEANRRLFREIAPDKVEYLEPDPTTLKTVSDTPNKPPRVV